MEEYRFQVNLKGMVEILSEHLYSSPDVFVRELLQNGVDAIVGREKEDEKFIGNIDGRIIVEINEGRRISFKDNGKGLTEDEIHRFLAVIGSSSKYDLENAKNQTDYIGRFGIGLLSCFMVSDSICVRTKSINENMGYEWCGKPDGTYTLEKMDGDMEVGTEIILEAKMQADEYYYAEKVEELLLYYGLILPYPIFVRSGEEKKRINPVKLPWENEYVSKEELLVFGQMIYKMPFMDCIILKSEEGGVHGVAYILPYEVQTSIKQKHMIYLKNMFLTEDGSNIIPPWAVFTKCIINAKTLRPTASRESLYEDDILKRVRENIGECISDYLKRLANEDKMAFRKFLNVHSMALKGMAVADDDVYKNFMEELEFVTTKGRLTGRQLRMSNEILLYCGMEEYRQLSQIFVAQGRLLVNVGYVYDRELIIKMPHFFGTKISHADGEEVGELLKDVRFSEQQEAVDFLIRAERVLAPYDCDVEIKQFIPANLPAFYYINDDAKLYKEIERIKDVADDIFGDMLMAFSQETKERASSILYFNYRNPIVKKLISRADTQDIDDIIMILYVQTLLIGGFTLKNNEMALMNEKLLAVMERIL